MWILNARTFTYFLSVFLIFVSGITESCGMMSVLIFHWNEECTQNGSQSWIFVVFRVNRLAFLTLIEWCCARIERVNSVEQGDRVGGYFSMSLKIQLLQFKYSYSDFKQCTSKWLFNFLYFHNIFVRLFFLRLWMVVFIFVSFYSSVCLVISLNYHSYFQKSNKYSNPLMQNFSI